MKTQLHIKNLLVTLIVFVGFTFQFYAGNPEQYVVSEASAANYPLATKGEVSSILVSKSDYSGVLKVVNHLKADLKTVTGAAPSILNEKNVKSKNLVIIGTYGKSEFIQALIKRGKIEESLLKDKREKFVVVSVNNPLPGIDKALVIAGSDKRGTIYGIYDLSYQIGVSPWHFWADVPAVQQTELHVLPGIHTQNEPKVKYRGIFINDEAPALSGWVTEQYGAFNSDFYEKVFELILRLKGNYLWPAMWGRMFYVEDERNAELADEYGIVMGTSHHEPLTRAHAEWEKFGTGDWNFNTNPEGLIDFWTKGMQRMGTKESLVTIGMRGDGDEPMTEGTAIELLENIVKTQRDIIENVTGKPAEETPQIWALYKEVQDYYEKGMKVPDDVTLLLCDDNWGNLRTLPDLDAKPRQGGYGIYYHFDYVGGPRSYKWINTTQIERVWEQMHLAYKHGVDEVWIVNVGDIKPMEFPTEFFLDFAWNPEAWHADNLTDYYDLWAKKVFGGHQTQAIADLLRKSTKYIAARKPELLDASTFSLQHYNEADSIVSKYQELENKAVAIKKTLPEQYQDAYYQLVLYPILATSNLNKMYVSAAKNKLFSSQGRASTNFYAKQVDSMFQVDESLTKYYHHTLANGKWNHMMAQTHIGYTTWQDPSENIKPEVSTIPLPNAADMGISLAESDAWWPNNTENAVLPEFDNLNDQTYYIDVFNRGKSSFEFIVESDENWLRISEKQGNIKTEKRIYFNVNWKKIPLGTHETAVVISGAGKKIPVKIKVNHLNTSKINGFVENNGVISISAESFSEKTESKQFSWKVIPNLGKTGSAVMSLPVETGRVLLSKKSTKLSYPIHLKSKGRVKVHLYFSPTINYATRSGMLFGLSFNEAEPIEINYDSDPNIFNYNGKVPKQWEQNVADNIKVIIKEFEIDKSGNHTLNYYRIDEGLILQKIIIETEDSALKDAYFGPPESKKANNN